MQLIQKYDITYVDQYLEALAHSSQELFVTNAEVKTMIYHRPQFSDPFQYMIE